MSSSPTSGQIFDQEADASCAKRLLVDGELTINEIARWHAMFTERIADGADLIIDLGAVSVADAIGIQLLCAAKRTGESQGKRVRMQGAGSAIRCVCERAGIAPADAGIV